MSVSIRKYPVSLVVKNILTDRFSGELVIKSKDLNKSLHFQDGDLVFASSDVFDERIGVILYLLGKLNDQQYEYIRKLESCNDLEIGNILVQNRFVTRDDLFYTTLFQMKKAAINAFKISRGEWEMISQEPVFELDPEQRIQLPPIIAEGARKIEDMSFFLNKIQFMVPRTTRIPEPLRILLSSEEVALYRRLEDCKRMTSREIISKLNLDPQLYWKNLVLFILLDLIDFSSPRQKIDVEDNIRQLLEFQTKLSQGNLDSYGILGVSPRVPKAKAKLAFLRLSRQFHPDRFGSAAAPEIKKIAGLVCDQIEKAYKDLKKQYKKKRKEDKRITDSAEQLVFQPEADELFEIELDESGEAQIPESQESVEAEIFESLKSDEVKIPKSEPSTEGDVSEPEEPGTREISEAGEEKAEPAQDAELAIISMKEEMKEIVKAGTLPTGAIPVESGERKKKTTHAPPTETDILERAEELYMEKKYHDACQILKTALKNKPDKGEYHYLLGLCQTHMEFFQEEAERHLKKAVELNPWNSDPVYALGILFRIQGKTRQAASCFERVMKISKDHSKAVKAMRELSKKTRKKSTLFHFLKKDN